MTKPQYNFRWFRDGEDSEIPAELLADALRSAQRAFHYAGMIVENADRLSERVRARVPTEVAKKYILRCKPAIQGSFDMPTVLGNEGLVDDVSLDMAAILFDAAVDVGRMHATNLVSELPSGAIGRAFLNAVAGIVPPRGSGWSLEVKDGQNNTRLLTEDAHKRLEDMARLFEDRPTIDRGTVTGELRAINFARKQITILHPVDNRELECTYDITDEATLIDHRLSLVHVTGRLIRDASGRITSIDEVDRIEPLDESDIEIGRVAYEGTVIRPTARLVLKPIRDEEANSQWMTVNYEPLGLLVTAATRSLLVDAIREEIAFLWGEYVMDAETDLTHRAEELALQLKAHFQEWNNAET